LFVIEGEKVVGELLAAKFPLLEIYATPAWPAPPGDARVREVTVEDMARASHFPTPATVLPWVKSPAPNWRRAPSAAA